MHTQAGGEKRKLGGRISGQKIKWETHRSLASQHLLQQMAFFSLKLNLSFCNNPTFLLDNISHRGSLKYEDEVLTKKSKKKLGVF